MTIWLLTALLWLSMSSVTLPEPTLTDYRLEYRGHVPSSYGVADGYWHFTINHSFPVVPMQNRYAYRKSEETCWEQAAAVAEPYTGFYHPRPHEAQVGKQQHLL
jgi:hypothetical protein